MWVPTPSIQNSKIFNDWHTPLSTRHGLEVGGKALRNAIVSKTYVLSNGSFFGKMMLVFIQQRAHTLPERMTNKDFAPEKWWRGKTPFCLTSFQGQRFCFWEFSCHALHATEWVSSESWEENVLWQIIPIKCFVSIDNEPSRSGKILWVGKLHYSHHE